MLKQKIHSFLSLPYWSILITLIVAYLCFTPSENLPTLVGDKSAHFFSFAVISFFWLVRYPSLSILAALIFFGAFIEFIQSILPEDFHRGFEYYDIFADAIGVIIGFGIYKVYEYFVKSSFLGGEIK